MTAPTAKELIESIEQGYVAPTHGYDVLAARVEAVLRCTGPMGWATVKNALGTTTRGFLPLNGPSPSASCTRGGRVKPAIRIVFAPLFKRDRALAAAGKDLHGRVMIPGRTIQIDPRSPNILDTLVHEMTHVRHPDWSEQMVVDYAKIWMKKSGWRRKAEYLKLLGTALIEGEEP